MAKAATIMRDEESLGGKLKQFPMRIKSFLSDVRNEMRKVTFPSRKEVQATTLVVIITVIIFGVYFFVIVHCRRVFRPAQMLSRGDDVDIGVEKQLPQLLRVPRRQQARI